MKRVFLLIFLAIAASSSALAQAPCTGIYCGDIGTYGWVQNPLIESDNNWVEDYRFKFVRGVISMDFDAFMDKSIDLYGGKINLIPVINKESTGEILDIGKKWAEISKNPPRQGYNVIEISLDDWIELYFQIGLRRNNEFDSDLSERKMLDIINGIHEINPNLPFGVTIYEDELGLDSRNSFFRNERKDYSKCVRCSGSSSASSFVCSECSGCCIEKVPFEIPNSVLDKIDVVHLYFHQRLNSVRVKDYLDIVKSKFPNAEIVLGQYIWGTFSVNYEKRGYAYNLNEEEAFAAFQDSVIQTCNLMKKGRVNGFEIYPSVFEFPAQYSFLGQDDIESAIAYRDFALDVLKNDCVPSDKFYDHKSFLRGDANQDEVFDISDELYILGYLFVDGMEKPTCLDALDSDDSGVIDLTDGIYLLNWLFQGDKLPLPPNLETGIGHDWTPDGLSCESYKKSR